MSVLSECVCTMYMPCSQKSEKDPLDFAPLVIIRYLLLMWSYIQNACWHVHLRVWNSSLVIFLPHFCSIPPTGALHMANTRWTRIGGSISDWHGSILESADCVLLVLHHYPISRVTNWNTEEPENTGHPGNLMSKVLSQFQYLCPPFWKVCGKQGERGDRRMRNEGKEKRASHLQVSAWQESSNYYKQKKQLRNTLEKCMLAEVRCTTGQLIERQILAVRHAEKLSH